MHTIRAARCGLVLLAVAAATGALADTASTVTVSDLQVQAVDLDANDGITGSVWLDPATAGNPSYNYTAVQDFALSSAGDGQMVTGPQYSPLPTSTSGSIGGTHASTYSAGDIFGSGMSLAANTFAQSDGTSPTWGDTVLKPNGNSLTYLVVSPNTEIKVTGSWDISNTGTGIIGEGWQSQVLIRLKGVGTGGNLESEGNTGASFTLTFDNLSSTDQSVIFDTEVFARSFTVQNVPEPANLALLLAGLGVVGGVARRRRGKLA